MMQCTSEGSVAMVFTREVGIASKDIQVRGNAICFEFHTQLLAPK